MRLAEVGCNDIVVLVEARRQSAGASRVRHTTLDDIWSMAGLAGQLSEKTWPGACRVGRNEAL